MICYKTDFFADIGSNMNSKFTHDLPVWHLPESIYKFHFTQYPVESIYDELIKLTHKSKVDILAMDTKLINICAPVIAPALAHIFNLSLRSGNVPDDFKLARVTPIYKKSGSIDDCGNYRPISVVSHLAKVLEKLVGSQLITYINENSFITPSQSAFLRLHSTHTALHKVIDNWLEAIDTGLITGVCFYDMKKCFDSINHKILLFKLNKYGICDVEHKWFASYLANRRQTTVYQGSQSKFRHVSTGIPQGSVLGPTIFLLYMNDLAAATKYCNLNLYADDTSIDFSSDDLHTLVSNLQVDVNNILHWFHDNKLSINVNKTFAMLIGSRKRLDTIENIPHILVNNVPLPYMDQCKYLGVTLDKHLSWDIHIDNLCKKLKPKVGVISRLRHILNKNLLNTVYKTIIQPHIDYAITLWGSSSISNVTKIQRFQNRSARLITGNFDLNTQSKNLLTELNLMNVTQRFEYFVCILMFKCLTNEAPNHLIDNITFVSNLHNYGTRNPLNMIIPKARTEHFQRSIIVKGPQLWNKLPIDIQRSPSITVFKHALRSYLT